jgi:hypothetical protein
MPMVRNFWICASLVGLMLLSASARAYSAPRQSQNNQESADAKTVSGKVASIGSDHKSFSLEVSGGNTMQFLLDNNTQVQGSVTTGTTAIVQYQKTGDGRFLALTVAPQNQGQSPQ